MGLKLEVGKYYRDQNGRKIGPIVDHGWSDGFNFYGGKGMGFYNEEGRRQNNIDYIVSEWTTGPVRTVTRKEIVFGVHGDVEIVEDDTHQGGIGIYINATMNAARIRAAANSMLAVADAMEDNHAQPP